MRTRDSRARVLDTIFLIRFDFCISDTEPLEPKLEPKVLYKPGKEK